MEQLVLTDKEIVPTEELIFSFIGKYKILWQSVFEYIHSNYPTFTEQWNYYKDGNRWLLKVTNKSKTIFWLAILKDTFRMTFYFTDKAEQAIMTSTISDELKAQFMNGKKYNKIKAVSIVFKNKKDIEYAKQLIEIKLNGR
jgi:ABC-type uncharacterized transport system YnjBCD substrate-binding protein